MSEGSRIQFLAALGASLGQGTVGHLVSFSAFTLPQLYDGSDQITIDEETGSWLASMFAIGSLTGSITGSLQCDKFGRRWSMLIDCIGYIASFLLMALAPNFPVLLLGRWLGSHCAGSNLVSAPIFISETSHPNMRGMTGTMIMVLYTIGFTVNMFLGALVPWRQAVLLTLTTPVLSALILLFMKESPTWLLKQGKEEEALKSLEFYRGQSTTTRIELDRILVNIRILEKEQQALGGGSAWKLFQAKLKRMSDPSFWKPFLILNLMLNIGLEWCGFPALALYMHTVLEKLNIPFDVYWGAAYISTYRMLVTISLSFLLKKVPRRSMYLGSGCVVILALFMQGTYAYFGSYLPAEWEPVTQWTPLVAIILQYTGFGLGYGPIVFIMQGELLPSDMRSFGSGLLGVLDNAFLFASIKSVPSILSSLGTGGAFTMYGCICVVNFFLCSLLLPETKGMSLEDIEDYYRNTKKEIKEEEKIENKATV